MTKKNTLLAAIGVGSLTTLFAFTYPESVRENVLTLLFPDRAVRVAPVAPVAPAADEASAETASLDLLATPWQGPGPTDTFPPLEERFDDFLNDQPTNPYDLRDPNAIEQNVEYDPVTNRYIVTEKIGDDYFRSPTYMTFDEYARWRDEQQRQAYFDRLQGAATGENASASGVEDPIAKFNIKNSLLDRLFGGTNVDIRPQGNINLTFGYDYQRIQNPILTLRQQSIGNFDFDMDININASGKIGEKLNLNFNYNTQATFDFDNQMKIDYDTKGFSEDEIVQNIEAGNVSMPLRSQLIKGAQNLFGIKTELKFGHLRTTLIASQQRSRQQNLTLQGGSQVQQFARQIDEYDENRHFFFSHWNRDQFEPAMSMLPVPMSLFTVTRLEVWITNDKLATENVRDIVALADLGEGDPTRMHDTTGQYVLPVPPGQDVFGNPLPANQNNLLYDRVLSDTTAELRRSDRVVSRLRNDFALKQVRDFEKVRGRLLSPSEYTYHDQLGFVSINLNVQPDQVVGIAMEYTYNGRPFKIGEFTSEVPSGDSVNQNVLFLKMLKSSTPNVRLPIWDLMMKNVYAVGTANVDPQEFLFDIFYEDPGKGFKRFLDDPAIPTEFRQRPLLQIFNLDQLNRQQDPGPDGIFDFVPGLTINLRSGRIMFPVLEPFGDYLIDKLLAAGADSATTVARYTFPQLYDSTLFRAREFQQLNRYTLRGSYKSSTSSEISLGTFNLPQGSVRVSAGGRQLVENVDYTVDYNIGRVKILNDAILQSGQSVNVSFEDNTLFGFQARTMLGARFDYEVNKDINIGATVMNLFERPLTQKVNYGEDPINNKMYGLDFNISKKAPWLTRMIDRLPLLSTKAESSITAQAEVAMLDAGHNRAINQGQDGGIVYIDDFEGSTANLPLANPANAWIIASTPGDFPEAQDTSLALNANRAGMSWYIADPSARDQIDAQNPYTQQIQYQDIFPNRQLTPLEQSILRPLDVTIYPRERGPYNFDRPDGYPGLTRGLLTNGQLNEPATRWAGFMRGLQTNDFESANIEFIEFWMLNPYMDKGNGEPVTDQGDMVIDLGNVSEDIMRDSRQFFENAIPTVAGTGITVDTRWGRVPTLPPVVIAFDNDPAKRTQQDVGLDGVDDAGEKDLFKDWYNEVLGYLSPNARTEVEADPASDNFLFFRDPAFNGANAGLLKRYRRFNNQQGNSPVNNTDNLNPSATNQPDMEDLNRDNSLNENESFFRYRIKLRKLGNELDLQTDTLLRQLITDIKVDDNGYTWYRFKLPLDLQQRQAIGGIQDFRSIRFMRMFWQGFTEQTTFRFATLELGRNQWRRFTQSLRGCDNPEPDKATAFDVNAVSIEENSARTPFNYTLPVGLQREQSVGAFPDVLQNEQSLSMTVCSLAYCDARGIFKPLNMNLTQYQRLRMWVHAEGRNQQQMPLEPNKVAIFVRLGSDFVSNYYEYELPLLPSDSNQLNNNPDSREYKDEVWKPENNVDFPLELLTEVKKRRNAAGVGLDQLFWIADPNNPKAKIYVRGNPNLGYVKGAMVGVRNVDTTDIQYQCVEVWINELRLNGLNNRGGYAGLARVDMKLADLGNVSVAGNYSSFGWGSMENRLLDRQLEEITTVDVSTNIELGKFLPEKSGIRIPFYAQYSNRTSNPEYDPYDLDIKLKDKIRASDNPDEVRRQAQDVTIVRGFNFTNVRKERKGGTKRPMPWDIENFSLTYAFNQQKQRTPYKINDQLDQYRGALDYNYVTGLKPIQPFKGLIKKDKYFKWITEFNFNPIPNTYGFNTNVDRIVGITTWRFAGEDPALNTYYNRRFTWDRNYDLGWDISKSLRFNFDATARSIIDEPQGRVTDTGMQRDSIWSNILKLGRPKNYTHNVTASYTLPFRTLPGLDWITVKASYTGGYTWSAQSLKQQNLQASSGTVDYRQYLNSRHLGNTIQNNSTRQINGDFNFEGLYNKSKYLAKINKPGKSVPGRGGRSGGDDDKGGRGGRGGRGGDAPGGTMPDGTRPPSTPPSGKNTPPAGSGVNPGSDGGLNPAGGGAPNKGGNPNDPLNRDRTADRPNTPGGNPAIDPATGRPTGPGNLPGGVNPNAPAGRGTADVDPSAPGGAPGDTGDGKDGGKGNKDKGSKAKDKSKNREPSLAERIALRPLMLLRKARFTYSETYGTIIPGFTPDPKLLGLSQGVLAPGWEFIAGFQPESRWLDEAARQGWITHRPELNQQVTRNFTQNFDAGITLEPFQDFRVELTANRQYTRNSTELFKDQNFDLNPDAVQFEHRAQRDFGSFTVSYFTLNTLFDRNIDGLFQRFANNRPVISNRLGLDAGNTDPHDDPNTNPGYVKGYGRIQQEVLIPSFIAAYTDQDPNQVGLNLFKTRPALNWKLTYNGLTKVGKLNKIFSSVQITHGYKSTLTVNSFNTDIFYDPAQPQQREQLSQNYIARYEIPQVVISEQLAPLLGVDIKLKNEMTFRTDFKKSRQLGMSFIDYQLAETQSESYTIGFGYRMKNVVIPFLMSKKAKKDLKKAKAAAKRKPRKGEEDKNANPAGAPPPATAKPQGNDLNFKFDFELRDDITVNHRLDQLDVALPTRGARTISINPSIEYALNKRLKLRLFTDYRKTVPKTSQSFPITTVASGVTVQFSLN